MAASVKKSGTEYEVEINGKTIMLPEGSEYTDDYNTQIGTMGKPPEKYLELDGRGFVVDLFENGEFVETIVEDDEDAYGALVSKWEEVKAEEKAKGARRRRSRLNGKTRRSKRNGRNTKHRKLRKLSTRRR
jgi:hypothetical protein